ncbi:YkvA family protein [Cellulomonas marina]|uniref:DUF1232 domain-containing protein n=1 Tax=Cellulomonas marina TaxID=988821 RepID=A0A1I0XZR3_9CELL|nr:YkvA family protein [Cellulomonas marina]GIG28428.1 hypothetical protein Cma02nite_10280 [Cellulomonas marina]SFB06525.1 Protein of unknown function [Cellulomonas marina]
MDLPDGLPGWLGPVLGVLAGLALVWVALLVVLWREQRRHGDATGWREAARLVPDVVRLVRRLLGDPAVPRSSRVWLGVLLVYLASPLDLVPDVVPVLGYADDAVAVALVLRHVVRRAGAGAVERHWPGTPAGLRTVLALAGVSPRRPGPPAPR